MKKNEEKVSLVMVKVSECSHSRFNTRKTRSDEQIAHLAERIKRNGFEQTRAPLAVTINGHYEVFAGGTRLESARQAGLHEIPVWLHEGLTDEEIARRADIDNENDEYHVRVPIVDVWAEYHRLWKDEGWEQKQIAKAKGTTVPQVSLRCKLHTDLSNAARKAVSDEMFDEGHCEAILSVTSDVGSLHTWLTSEQAQSELVEEVLGKHRGSTAGVKPTVAVVRKAAARWKTLIKAGEEAYLSLTCEKDGDRWQKMLVKLLANKKEPARTVAAVTAALTRVVEERQRAAEEAAAAANEEVARQEQIARQLARIESMTNRVIHGDAREAIKKAPFGFNLLLADPPYGMDYQSQRRKATPKKDHIANDSKDEAMVLLADVLKSAFSIMAKESGVLVFCSRDDEPEVRSVIAGAGFVYKASLIWVKHNHSTGDLKWWAPRHERIICAIKGDHPGLQNGRLDDVLFGKDKQNSDHPTEKPRDLLKTLIQAMTQPGECVVDPFAGSGSTLYEAHALDRNFFGCELDDSWYKHVVDEIHRIATDEEQESE